MKPAASNRGYTIIEVLIFLAVSGFILVSALVVVNGRQEQVQYQQAVREIDADIRATISDVSNGYFPDSVFSCSYNGEALEISDVDVDTQGSRQDCVFAGKVIIPSEDEMTYVTLAGLRPPLGQAITNIAEAALTPINDSPDISIIRSNPWGLRVDKVADESGEEVAYVAYISSFGRAAQSGQLDSGNQNVRLYKSLSSLSNPLNGDDLALVNDSIYFCLESNNGNRKAVIILGEDSRQLTTTLDQDAEGKYTQCEP